VLGAVGTVPLVARLQWAGAADVGTPRDDLSCVSGRCIRPPKGATRPSRAALNSHSSRRGISLLFTHGTSSLLGGYPHGDSFHIRTHTASSGTYWIGDFPLSPQSLMKLVLNFRFGQNILENRISNEVEIETKGIGPRIALLSSSGVRNHHAIVCPQRIGDARPKSLSQDAIVSCQKPALIIHIKLSERDPLTQSYLLPFKIFDRDARGLIPACPDDEICLFKMRLLKFWRLRFDYLDTLLITFHDSFVKPLRISTKSSERIKKPVLVAKTDRFKVCIAIEFGVFNPTVEDLDLVPV